MNYLKELRRYKRLTQRAASILLGISLRSYLMYENDPERLNTRKYREYVSRLEDYEPRGEERRLTLRRIKAVCKDTLSGYYIKKCILLGNYTLSELIVSDTLYFVFIIPDDSDFTGRLAGQKLKNILHTEVDIKCISVSDWEHRKDTYADAKTTVYMGKPFKNVHTATKKSLL